MRNGTKIVLGGLVVLAGCGEGESSDSRDEALVAGSASLTEDRFGGSALSARCPHDMPAALNLPADATLTAGFPARGVQIYVCTASNIAGNAPAWVLKAPHAILFKGQEPAVIHFAGPSWQALDGSLVTGTRTASAPAPDGTSLPWLTLQAATNVGPGLLGDVTWIQRLATQGGAAPATGCDAGHLGAQVLSPYRADYFFYHPAVEGKRVHQCAGTT